MQDTINSFEHQVGLVEAIDDKKNSRSLAEAINDKKRIIICTIQKFLFAKKDMEKFRGRKFAIIIDEAHQGQNGESAKSLRRSLIDIGVAIKEYAEEAGIEEEEVDLTDEYINAVIGQGRHDNQSFFAFTATPKGQTLESFGTVVGMTPEGEPIKAPFHVYSMRQAILFPSPRTGGYWSPDAVSRINRKLLAKAGIEEHVRFHDLRHTFATMALFPLCQAFKI